MVIVADVVSVEAPKVSATFFKHPKPCLLDLELSVKASDMPLDKGFLTVSVNFDL